MSSQGTLPSMEKLEGSSNYCNWKFLMQMYLMHEDLWDCIETDGQGNVLNKDPNEGRICSAAEKPNLEISGST